jgi:DNA-binding MarR family transcriptional regulator
MSREALESLFLREKPALALLAVDEGEPAYPTAVAKAIDSTFPHTCGILAKLEAHGLIKSRPEGRVRYLVLTDRGRKIALALRNLREMMKEPGPGWGRLERLKQMASTADGPLGLGPLRRDLEKLKGSKDDSLTKAVEALEKEILDSINPG